MKERLDGEWLSLSAAARLLGVHPSTVRSWSDQGALPVYRTTGGHRRYKRKEVELWAQASRETRIVEPFTAMQSAVSQIRFHIADGRLEAEPWYQKLDQEARMQYRLGGMSLVNGLLAFLAADGQEARSEAYAIGYEYASRARRYQLSYVEATRAFLFFRDILIEAIMQVYEGANIPSGIAWVDMLHKINTFTDEILLNLLDTYHTLDEAKQ